MTTLKDTIEEKPHFISNYRNYAANKVILSIILASIRGANNLMKGKTQLTAYELGLIRSSLRERMITLEDFRTEYLDKDEDDVNEKAEMSLNVDSFKLDLDKLRAKIEIMLETEINNASLQGNQ